MVKLYQMIERISAANPTGAFSQQCSRDQIASAQAAGCSVEGYMWLYAHTDTRQGIRDAVELARSSGIDFDKPMWSQIPWGPFSWRKPILWVDIESYTDGSIPDFATVLEALDECGRQGVPGGIYTGAGFWARLGNPSLPGVALWSANYNGRADLQVPIYGDMLLAGHQWTDTPCDRSVFRSDFTQ